VLVHRRSRYGRASSHPSHHAHKERLEVFLHHRLIARRKRRRLQRFNRPNGAFAPDQRGQQTPADDRGGRRAQPGPRAGMPHAGWARRASAALRALLDKTLRPGQRFARPAIHPCPCEMPAPKPVRAPAASAGHDQPCSKQDVTRANPCNCRVSSPAPWASSATSDVAREPRGRQVPVGPDDRRRYWDPIWAGACSSSLDPEGPHRPGAEGAVRRPPRQRRIR
jgi:hypothetical protein